MTLEIKNKRSAALNSAPTAAQLEDGEIGINYNADSLALYIKDTNGDIRKIAGSGSEGLYWDLTGSTLSPDSNTYGVEIGGGNIKLNADGNVELAGKATSANTVSGDSGNTLTTKGYVDAAVAGASGATDLGIANRTATTLDVTSSTGTNATVPAATTTEAGLMTDAQFDKLDGISPGAQVNVQSNWTETDSSADSFIQNKPVIPTDFGVLSIVAGNNITIDPATGVGNVTINATESGGASIEVSDNPPGNASTGDLWWDSSEGADSNGGRLYLYYTDEWVQTSNVGASATSYWQRSGTTLSPENAGDNLRIDGLININNTGFIRGDNPNTFTLQNGSNGTVLRNYANNTDLVTISDVGNVFLDGSISIGGTAAANTIRDYERGVWVPKDNNGNIYFTNETPTYVKIGDLVFVSFDITATNDANGNEVTNLPFAALSDPGGNFCFYNGLITNIPASTGGHTNATKIVLYSGSSAVTLTPDDRLIMSGTYITNE